MFKRVTTVEPMKLGDFGSCRDRNNTAGEPSLFRQNAEKAKRYENRTEMSSVKYANNSALYSTIQGQKRLERVSLDPIRMNNAS